MGNAASNSVAPEENEGGSLIIRLHSKEDGEDGSEEKRPPQASDLFAACRRGDFAEAKLILSYPDVDVNMLGGNRASTSLMIAIQNNFPDIVALLLECPDIDLYHVNDQGATALLYGCMMGFENVVAACIRRPDPDCPVAESNSQVARKVFNSYFNKILDACPLSIACVNNRKNVVSMLLNAGCDKNSQFDFESWTTSNHAASSSSFFNLTPLHLACSCGSIDVIKELIARGADVSILDEEGITALYHCVRCLNEATAYEILRIFKSSSYGIPTDVLMSVEPMGNSLLHIAAERQQILVCLMLLQEGCNVNRRNVKTGLTPLHIAIKRRNSPLVSLFLQNGSDPLIPDANGVSCQALVEKWNKTDVIFAKISAAVDAWMEVHRKHEINNITDIIDLEDASTHHLLSPVRQKHHHAPTDSSPQTYNRKTPHGSNPRHAQPASPPLDDFDDDFDDDYDERRDVPKAHNNNSNSNSSSSSSNDSSSSSNNNNSNSSNSNNNSSSSSNNINSNINSSDSNSSISHINKSKLPAQSPVSKQIAKKYKIGDKILIGNSVNESTLPATIISPFNERNDSYLIQYEDMSREFVSLKFVVGVVSLAAYDPVIHEVPFPHVALPQYVPATSTTTSASNTANLVVGLQGDPSNRQSSYDSPSRGSSSSSSKVTPFTPPSNRKKTQRESLFIGMKVLVGNSMNDKIAPAVIASTYNFMNGSYIVSYENNTEEFVSPKHFKNLPVFDDEETATAGRECGETIIPFSIPSMDSPVKDSLNTSNRDSSSNQAEIKANVKAKATGGQFHHGGSAEMKDVMKDGSSDKRRSSCSSISSSHDSSNAKKGEERHAHQHTHTHKHVVPAHAHAHDGKKHEKKETNVLDTSSRAVPVPETNNDSDGDVIKSTVPFSNHPIGVDVDCGDDDESVSKKAGNEADETSNPPAVAAATSTIVKVPSLSNEKDGSSSDDSGKDKGGANFVEESVLVLEAIESPSKEAAAAKATSSPIPSPKDTKEKEKEKEVAKRANVDKDSKTAGKTISKKVGGGAKADLSATAPIQIVDIVDHDDENEKEEGFGGKIAKKVIRPEMSRTEPLQAAAAASVGCNISNATIIDDSKNAPHHDKEKDKVKDKVKEKEKAKGSGSASAKGEKKPSTVATASAPLQLVDLDSSNQEEASQNHTAALLHPEIAGLLIDAIYTNQPATSPKPSMSGKTGSTKGGSSIDSYREKITVTKPRK